MAAYIVFEQELLKVLCSYYLVDMINVSGGVILRENAGKILLKFSSV